MPDTITLTSTTDDEAQVRSALGLTTVEAPKEPAKEAAKAAEPAKDQAVIADPADADEADESGDEAKGEQHEQLAQARRRKGRLQARIDELSAKANAEAARAAALQAEVEAYRARVQELAGRSTAPKALETPAKAVADANVPAEPKVDDFATYEDYTKAVAKWSVAIDKATRQQEIDAAVEARLRQARTASQQDNAAHALARLQAEYRASEEAMRTAHEDYDEVVNDPALPATQLMMDQLLQSEHKAALTYYLATHPEECKRIAALGNTAAALKAFGRIEAQFEAARKSGAAPTAARETPATAPAVASPPEQKPAPKPVATKAPDPITPVGASQAAPTTVDPSTMAFRDYVEWRNAQSQKRSGLK